MTANLILLLLSALSSPSFEEREAATVALRSLDGLAIPILRAAECEDCEARRRVRGLLDDHRATFRPSAYPMLPWIDMLPPDFPGRDGIMAEHLAAVPYAGEMNLHPHWLRYRVATSTLIDAWIAEGRSRGEVIRLLDGMVERELEYIRRNDRGPRGDS